MDANLAKLETMTEPELRELIRNAEQALQHLVAQRAKATLKDIRRLAAEVGFEVTFSKAGKAGGGRAAVSSPRGKLLAPNPSTTSGRVAWFVFKTG